MTVAVSIPVPSEPASRPPGPSRPVRVVRRSLPEPDATLFAPLLEDPSLNGWAVEAAERYHVSALGALSLLAYALEFDAMR
jgi:hypothetical protein